MQSLYRYKVATSLMIGICIDCKMEKEVSPTGQRDGKLYGVCLDCKLLNEIEGNKID